MGDTSVKKVKSEYSPKGKMGQKYLASGIHVSMRLWEIEKPGQSKPASVRDYETVGFVISGRAELHLEGQMVLLEPGDVLASFGALGTLEGGWAATLAPPSHPDDAIVLRASAPVLLDCWADWCGPCHALAPTIDDIARAHAGRLVVGKLDVDANPETASRFGVRSIPTLLLFKDGQLVERIVGAQPRGAIEARLHPLITGVAAR